MLVINLITLIFFLVLLKWLWHNLGDIEKEKKIIYTIIGITFTFLYTLIIYNISQKGIQYENVEVRNYIKTPLLFLFAVVNGFILLPFVFNTIERLYNDNIEKNKFQIRLLVVIIVLIILAIFEINYLNKTQVGILNMQNKKSYSKVILVNNESKILNEG